MPPLHCLFVTPHGTVHDEPVWQITVPGAEGRFSIRAGHAPVLTTITGGLLEIARTEKERFSYSVTAAVVEMNDNRCRITADEAVQTEK